MFIIRAPQDRVVRAYVCVFFCIICISNTWHFTNITHYLPVYCMYCYSSCTCVCRKENGLGWNQYFPYGYINKLVKTDMYKIKLCLYILYTACCMLNVVHQHLKTRKRCLPEGTINVTITRIPLCAQCGEN